MTAAPNDPAGPTPAPTPAPTPTPPQAPRRPYELKQHGDVRVDDYYWLGDKDDPAVLAYLEAENDFAAQVMAPTEALQERLFQAIKARVVENDCDAPVRSGRYWYWRRTEEGLPYPMWLRRHDPDALLETAQVLADARAGAAPEQLLLNQNEVARGHLFCALGTFEVSPDHRLLAYSADFDGSERYTLCIRDIAAAEDLPDTIPDVYYGSGWSADSGWLFYVRPDEAMRPYQVWRHRIGDASSDDRLIYEEKDERFGLTVGATRSRRFLLVAIESPSTSEYRYLDARLPEGEPGVVIPRAHGVEYSVEHAVWPEAGDQWVITSNHPRPDGAVATDFAVDRLPLDGTWADATEVLPHRPGVKVEGTDAFAGHLVVVERAGGLSRLRVMDLVEETAFLATPPVATYSMSPGSNPEWTAPTYRYLYSSLATPQSTVDVDLATGAATTVRVQPVRGWDPALYREERLWARAEDGTEVPISVVGRADRSAPGPCLLYGYGAYEIVIDPDFSTLTANLLEAGVVFAIAHIRGGGEMGRRWYEDGRLEHKVNTFSDFEACARHLVAAGWADPERLAARGGSAGGMLIGAVANRHPELWRALVAEVPFVDVLTTMCDPSLPLTIGEWEEWGDPLSDEAAYWRMKSYSPYDNFAAQDYPAVYATGGLNDPRVGYWEPAKWVAKLRTLSTGGRRLTLRTELGAGHAGPSGRYEVWRDEARVQAFLLRELGLEEVEV